MAFVRGAAPMTRREGKVVSLAGHINVALSADGAVS
jgi:hypothetical protein